MAQIELLPTILVADADPDTRSLYKESFAAAGYEVTESADGADALAKALNRPPRIIVAEIRLPGMDGYGLCEILRRDHATAKIPIVVVTSESRPGELERVKIAGANAVFVKPALLDSILDEIHRLLPLPATARDEAGRDVGELRSRHRLSRTYDRYETSAPPSHPPDLRCPSCDTFLEYDRSFVGGVTARHPEQWDYFTCPNLCGKFQYRQRTRKCRRVA